mmetsp:Transcript_9174/g.23217  ORF Transcript_9174/g.23217 Transcript_9174/m.23217 type:complete len:266 (+) Transcript_9174:616-1413(+)
MPPSSLSACSCCASVPSTVRCIRWHSRAAMAMWPCTTCTSRRTLMGSLASCMRAVDTAWAKPSFAAASSLSPLVKAVAASAAVVGSGVLTSLRGALATASRTCSAATANGALEEVWSMPAPAAASPASKVTPAAAAEGGTVYMDVAAACTSSVTPPARTRGAIVCSGERSSSLSACVASMGSGPERPSTGTRFPSAPTMHAPCMLPSPTRPLRTAAAAAAAVLLVLAAAAAPRARTPRGCFTLARPQPRGTGPVASEVASSAACS